MLNREEVLKLGFEEIPHFTVTNSLVYNLGRNRWLSIGDLGNPNEMLFIYEYDKKENRIINDLITLHNYDYDGYITLDKLYLLLSFFAENNKQKKLVRQNCSRRNFTYEEMIKASKYGYEFHKNTSFPEQNFEDSCIRNTQQWLTTFK